MSKLTVIRGAASLPPEPVLEQVRAFLFGGVVDGWRQDDKKGWRKGWRRLFGMEPGECAVVEIVIPRDQVKHRKFFALLNVGFEAWEPQRKHRTYKGRNVTKSFDQFRDDVTVLAGFFEQTFDLRGRMKIKAKSISFSKMNDLEFETLYSAVANVLLREVLTTYAGREELDEIVDRIMKFGD